MALTNAQKQAAYAKRRKAKIDRYEAALRKIVEEADNNLTDAGLHFAASIAEAALDTP